MGHSSIHHRGFVIPSFLYGTAWKEDRTAPLTQMALEAGFRGIDAANQRRHYHEAGVGEAIRLTLADGKLKRSDLFLQTKFTYAAGQDHRLPYDPAADFAMQVHQSFASSLEHLGTDYVDSYILHGPMYRQTLVDEDWEVWRAMEEIQLSGAAKLIGVSNVDPTQLRMLLDGAKVKPAFVQNRCFARTAWDLQVRQLCRANDIVYQGFSLLTANIDELNQPSIHKIAKRAGCSVAQLVFCFARQVGMLPITGTSSAEHMKEDLASANLELSADELKTIERIAV